MSEVLGIISVILGVISISLSVFIYKISYKTNRDLFTQILKDELRSASNKHENVISVDSTINIQPNNTSDPIICKEAAKSREFIDKIKTLLAKAEIENEHKVMKVITLALATKKVIQKENLADLLYYWKGKGYVDWNGELEVNTKIIIKEEEKIVDYFNSCEFGLQG